MGEKVPGWAFYVNAHLADGTIVRERARSIAGGDSHDHGPEVFYYTILHEFRNRVWSGGETVIVGRGFGEQPTLVRRDQIMKVTVTSEDTVLDMEEDED